MARIKMFFKGFKELAAKIEDENTLKKAVEESLEKSVEITNRRLIPAVNGYVRNNPEHKYATGLMKSAVRKSGNIQWFGNVAEIGVGFNLDIDKDKHSIFVMYGTERGMKKDVNIYNAIRGRKTRQEIEEVQRKTMEKYL